MQKELIHNFSLILLAAATGYARDAGMVAQVPFPFHVGDSLFSAGRYTVDTRAIPGTLQLKSVDSRVVMTIVCHGVQSLTAPAKGTLIFTKYGDQYFLFQVWAADSNRGHELRKSRREVELGIQTRLHSLIAAR
jgi:hypothetical protein